MGVTNTEIFSAAQNELAGIAKALAHPARIAILQCLLRTNTCMGGEIVDELPLAQPTVSRHLKELKAAGLIRGTIEGTRINYCIDGRRWREVQALLDELFEAYTWDKDCC